MKREGTGRERKKTGASEQASLRLAATAFALGTSLGVNVGCALGTARARATRRNPGPR